ncbi:MAG: class I adenylate-forming enzyme family protein [Deltaproteobacteria bacterium]
MSLTYEESLEQVVAAGSPFEIEEAEIDGASYKVFKNTPASLRVLFDSARLRGDSEFLVYEDERWSFAKTMQHVDAMGALLVEKYGVQKGDRVAIAMRNYPEWIVAFAAITSVGGIVVLLNAWWTPAEIEYGLSDSGSKVLICDQERMQRAGAAMPKLGVAGIVVRCASADAGFDRLEDGIELGKAMPAVEILPGDDATILYTSGTTGFPKGAVSTHRAVLNALMAFGCGATAAKVRKGSQGAAPQDALPAPACFILIVPLFHVTGCIAVMLGCWLGGSRLVMTYKWDPERALQLIEREKVTHFIGVPTQSWDLLECDKFADYDTSSLTNVGGGGAPAPPELVKRIDGSFKKGSPGIGYGMTETNAYGPQNSGADYLSKPTSAGRTVPILEMAAFDADGNQVAVGEVGELAFRGPNLIRGYWNKPEATAKTIVNGWLMSGDIGRIDEEGFVYVQDRAKDMVLRAGENIYCSEVEAAIYEFPGVHEAAVFGLPHERLGEEVAVAIYPRSGATIDVEEFRAFLAVGLAKFKIPTQVHIFEEPLPRNASGKILKRDLRDLLVAQSA